jgi:TonB family protein
MRSRTRPSEDEARGKEDGMSNAVEEGSEARRGETADEPAEEGKGAPGENRPGIAGREGQEASPGSPDSLPQLSDLRPSDELLSHAVGGGSNDYLKDVDEGADTLLNTKRWKHSSFFNRVKRGVAQTWRPENAYRLRDPTGQIYGQKNRFTVLKVSLRPDGSLRDVLVEKGSGVDFLDDEAVTAFREAQPFPNPPRELVDPESKLITFRFGFYFEIVGSPTFKIFRQ